MQHRHGDKRGTERGGEAWDDAVNLVRKNPAQAIGISIAAGAAIGVLAYALIARRDSNPLNKIRKISDASQDGWDTVKEALEKGVSGVKQALHDVQSSLRS